MFISLYKLLLRAPKFKGKARVEVLARASLTPKPVVVPGDVLMLLDPLEWTQTELLMGVPQEPKTAEKIRQLVNPGDTVVDVGAHVGWLSLIAAREAGEDGQVIAIDPQPYNCERLLENAAANGLENVLVIAGAIGSTSDTIALPHQVPTDKARLSLNGNGANDTALKVVVPMYTLQQILEMTGVKSVKLLKVDVEGFEKQVFLGAKPILRIVENIVFENLPETNNDEFIFIRQMLESDGFELRQIDGSPLLRDGACAENNVLAIRS